MQNNSDKLLHNSNEVYLVKNRPVVPVDVIWCYVSPLRHKVTSSSKMTSSSRVTSLNSEHLPRDTFYSVEKASCGIAMEVAKADSKTNWEALMNHINDSIR